MDLVTAWPPGKSEKNQIKNHSSAGLHDLSRLVSSSDLVRGNGANYDALPFTRHTPALLGSNPPVERGIRSAQFEMHLATSSEKRTHVYTTTQSEIGSSPKILDQVHNWRAKFPELALMQSEGQFDCPLFLFESRIRLTDDIRLGSTTLGIEFLLDYTGGAHYQDWCSKTRVHKQGFMPQSFDDSEFEKTPKDDLEFQLVKNRPDEIKLMIPFKSKWWVKLFSSIITKNMGARKTKDRETIKWAEQYPSAYFRELSMMQEIWATPRTGAGIRRPQRMAILLWTFNQARNGEAAYTTWRRLTTTYVSPYQIREPSISNLQPPMSLDSALHATMVGPYHDQSSQHEPQVDDGGMVMDNGAFLDSHPPLLTCQTSSCDTDSTNQLFDYQSFPSSTSTSFPSSISSSTYPPHHGSSFDSQDSCYPSIDTSFSHGDNNDYAIHEGDVLKSHPASVSAYESQDSIYESNPPSAHGNMTSFTPFESEEAEDEDTLLARRTQHDFSGAHMPLPADQGGNTNYEAPMIAPRASMIPPHHLEQQLENFERWVPTAGTGSLSLASPEEYSGRDDIVQSDIMSGDAGMDVVDGQDVDAVADLDEDRRLADFHHQQHQQLEYFNEAAQYWPQSLQPSMTNAEIPHPVVGMQVLNHHHRYNDDEHGRQRIDDDEEDDDGNAGQLVSNNGLNDLHRYAFGADRDTGHIIGEIGAAGDCAGDDEFMKGRKVIVKTESHN